MTGKQLLTAALGLGPALALGGALACAEQPAAQEHDQMAETMHSVEYLGGRPNSPFSEAVRVGNVLYLSGKLGTVPGEGLVEGGIVPETEQTMRNITDALERYGSSLDQVVKCTVFLADIADFRDMSSTYMGFFPDHRPARSAMAVGALVLDARVEIECIATVGSSG
ncbi:RidA family protein [Candidatus Palauibacter sp.]|uniref:RidA family protein n=1 Tax=Candidatus Palauibacter sp. TaxID=3101350 RepID=UPI003AF25A40